ncbi:regulatory protein TetR [Pseudonocardia dioxanivorans CB1190]|uniref:Regulatory protein TetR n=1 Tax=Pseudonocardia dioxanivorans (strain ATCC 55486 / DSM 44775 / JCM 13855 / CB1190) TaxID=675635 RepID=F4CRY8_PSEUX|nr:TetR/AcrR family transcriptional regulator [Pseudonocardia dioxanivorans]AEA28432.1 regulatory protein TetR [Pseudonocardia dioxanivorans CB1190]GJF02533.1 hypothetical protein PSD17_14960 [Pseudonocardia sp. D17]
MSRGPTAGQAPGHTPGHSPKGERTRQRLLALAQEMLAEGSALEVTALAERAGVSASVLYRYFDGKDGLVAAVVHAFYDEYDAAVFSTPAGPGRGWLEQEALRIEREVAFLYRHPLGRAVAAGLLHEPAATRADAERQRVHEAAAARNIRRAQRAGELPGSIDAGLAGAVIIGALRSALGEALGRAAPPPEAAVAEMVQAVGETVLRSRLARD